MVVLFVWALIFSKESWKKVERVQKSFLVNELRVEIQIPYTMMLVEISILALEAKELCQFIIHIIKTKHMVGTYHQCKKILNLNIRIVIVIGCNGLKMGN